MQALAARFRPRMDAEPRPRLGPAVARDAVGQSWVVGIARRRPVPSPCSQPSPAAAAPMAPVT